MAFFDYIETKYDNLKNQTYDFLRKLYSKSEESYSNASPFGQVVNVLNNFWQFSILTQKRAINNLIITESDNKKAINNLARIGGHNPTRPISASGTIKLKTKSNIDINNDIGGGRIRILDRTRIKNKTNGLLYCIRLGKSEDIFQVGKDFDIFLNVIQGNYETQRYTGNGEINQSFSVNIPASNTIDNFDVEVRYNGTSVTIKDSIFDMLPNELNCVVRTGMNGGIDVLFGNGNFGFVPKIGTSIEITYLLTEGIDGVILTPQINDFQFLDDITDMNDETISIDTIFDIYVYKQINFGSNGETMAFTKSLMPYVSRNFVLATPNQYIYTLRRLNLFSKINVYNTLNDKNYENDNKIFLFLVPNITNFFTGDINYFNVPEDAFYLDEEEKEKIITYLRKMGNISVGTVLDIIQPDISKYIINIYVQKFKGYIDNNIKSRIIDEVSNYLSTLQRDDRIVKSDLIATIESIEGVDSINLTFVSKKNEDYHKLNPNTTDIYGLDKVLGDVVVGKNELAIVRGGWSDRSGIYYSDNINENGLNSINIYFLGETEKNINNQ